MIWKEYSEITSKITRKNLAELSGISVESTIRILSEFKKDNIIDFEGKITQHKQKWIICICLLYKITIILS